MSKNKPSFLELHGPFVFINLTFIGIFFIAFPGWKFLCELAYIIGQLIWCLCIIFLPPITFNLVCFFIGVKIHKYLGPAGSSLYLTGVISAVWFLLHPLVLLYLVVVAAMMFSGESHGSGYSPPKSRPTRNDILGQQTWCHGHTALDLRRK